MSSSERIENLAILVPSCDKFSDVWPPFFTLLFKYWPNLQQNIYLLSNFKTYQDARVTPILAGQDISWSHNMNFALDKIQEDYVLVILEDFLLTNHVEVNLLNTLFSLMKQEEACYLRLMANPKPDIPHVDVKHVGFIKKGAAYRASLQMAIWKKSVLKQLLALSENPWEFEMQGSSRSNKLDDAFMSIEEGFTQPIPYFPNAIVRGKWVKEALTFLKTQSLDITYTRPAENAYDVWKRKNKLRHMLSVSLIQPYRRWKKSRKESVN